MNVLTGLLSRRAGRNRNHLKDRTESLLFPNSSPFIFKNPKTTICFSTFTVQLE